MNKDEMRRALELAADRMVEDVLGLAYPVSQEQADAEKLRNQQLVRHWTAERFHRKQYGERVDPQVTQTIDIRGQLEEARKRLATPVRPAGKKTWRANFFRWLLRGL